MEAKLFDVEPPESREYLASRPWMNLRGQPGFQARADAVVDVVDLAFSLYPSAQTVTELGAGDGSLLAALRVPNGRRWGYEIGRGDVAYAFQRGLHVYQADILRDELNYGDVLVVSEVLEHLADPDGFLRQLPPGRPVVASSPSLETVEWHNEIHAWAWDVEGYRELFCRNGYAVGHHGEIDGGRNVFACVEGPQNFQVLLAVRHAS